MFNRTIHKLSFALLSMCWGLNALPCRAAEITSLSTASGDNIIFLEGEIENGDEKSFKKEASKYDDALVLLQSNGGATAAAIEIGETIRLKGYATGVLNGSDCNSACALIWLAGTPRSLTKSARVGLHASYTTAGSSRSESGVANAIVGRYLTLLNLPERALIYATSASPDSLNWITATNYQPLGIDVNVVDDFDFGEDASRSSASSTHGGETTQWSKSGFWTVAVDHTLGDSCFLLAAFEGGTNFRIGFNGSAGSYLMIMDDDWTSLRKGQKFKLSLEFDSEGAWEVPVEVINMGDTHALLATFTESLFWDEFIKARTVQIDREDRRVAHLNLQGSSAAFDSLVACQRKNGGGSAQKDPFRD